MFSTKAARNAISVFSALFATAGIAMLIPHSVPAVVSLIPGVALFFFIRNVGHGGAIRWGIIIGLLFASGMIVTMKGNHALGVLFGITCGTIVSVGFLFAMRSAIRGEEEEERERIADLRSRKRRHSL
ncbi:MAG: hypothetical protein V1778_02330 [bacterium]